MPDKSAFEGYEMPVFHHPGAEEDEVFIGFAQGHELEAETPWDTIRFGDAEEDETGKIYPIFIKKQEMIDAGVIFVPARNLEEEAEENRI